MNQAARWFVIALALGCAACGLDKKGREPCAAPECGLTAQQVIEENLAAVGGADRIEAVDTLRVKGGFGSALLPPSQIVTLSLRKPGFMKQEGSFTVLLADDHGVVYNNGLETRSITGSELDDIQYRIGFYHHCFSLLNWKGYFQTAQLLGRKRYGETEQYELLFPGAEGGRDLLVYIDAASFLIDRIVYTIRHPDARLLKVVNKLDQYREIEGIKMPSYIVFDKVGWETSPTHLLISGIEVNPVLADDLFASAEIDFGRLVVEGDSIRAEILGQWSGSLMTNVRMEDLQAAGIAMKSWITARVGSVTREVRVLENIQTSAAEIKPGEIYLCQYGISGFPRFFLMGWNLDVASMMPCGKGDELLLIPLQDEEIPGSEG